MLSLFHCSLATFWTFILHFLNTFFIYLFILNFTPRLEQGVGPLPGSWTYHNNQVEPNRKDQLTVSGGNKVTVVMSKSSDRLSPMMRDTKSKFKKSQSIDEIDIGSYKVYRWVKSSC